MRWEVYVKNTAEVEVMITAGGDGLITTHENGHEVMGRGWRRTTQYDSSRERRRLLENGLTLPFSSQIRFSVEKRSTKLA
jgi:hypothetical protein